MQILTTSRQWRGARAAISPAEQMITSLTGLHTVFKPLYTLAGRQMDGSRAQCVCHSQPEEAAIGSGCVQKHVCMLNAMRCFVARKLPGYLYLDVTSDELADEQFSVTLLRTAGMLGLVASRLVLVVMDDDTGNIQADAAISSVASLRSAGVTIATVLLRGGNLQLALIEQLQPQCLLLYADQRYCLPSSAIASMLVLLPRMTVRAGCSVIGDDVDGALPELML